jgi:hypothetical protein
MSPVSVVGETAYGLEWAQYSSQKKLLMALNGPSIDFGDNLLMAFSGPRIDFERS